MKSTKFRAWLTTEEVMVQCHTIACENGTHSCYVPTKGVMRRLLKGENFFDVGAGEAALMQFTGLKDKNGKDIYEGDIVKYWHPTLSDTEARKIGTVGWADKNYSAWFINDDLMMGARAPKYEVIGNIYENP